MNDIKISLTILLPGRTMYSEEESSKPLNHETHFQKYSESGKAKPTILKYTTRKCRPAKQVLKMTSDAYNYMTSQEKPYDYKGNKPWQHLSKKDRVHWHMEETAKALGGTLGDYQVFDD